MKKTLSLLLTACTLLAACTHEKPMSVRMTESEMQRVPESWRLDFKDKIKWDYASGVELEGMLNTYERYGDERIWQYVLAFCDTMVNEDGTIKTYRPHEESLDRIHTAKLFYRVYDKTGEEKYKKALDLVRDQITHQPRTHAGGFWHKKVYPWQMWLDGLYMGSAFYAEYTRRYGGYNTTPDSCYADIVHQFAVVAEKTYDPATGLFRHAWDESHEQRWCDSITGQSAHSWGRAQGWFAMAIVDALEQMPADYAGTATMKKILNAVAEGVKNYQDPATGLWYQVLDCPGREGNYLESSCSSMFVFALYKAVRLGYLDSSYLAIAEKGYQGILDNFIEEHEDGTISLTRTCAVAGLGGKVYRAGDYNYYINEQIRSNDPKALGPFINASLEHELLHQ